MVHNKYPSDFKQRVSNGIMIKMKGNQFKQRWVDKTKIGVVKTNEIISKRKSIDTEYRKKWIERSVNAGKQAYILENAVIEKLKTDFVYVFRPIRVCDLIAITNDGKLVFIEIKNSGRTIRQRKLSDIQQKFKEVIDSLENSSIKHRVQMAKFSKDKKELILD
jgi:hypothetical protein